MMGSEIDPRNGHVSSRDGDEKVDLQADCLQLMLMISSRPAEKSRESPAAN